MNDLLGEEVIANALLQLKHFEIGEMLANILVILHNPLREYYDAQKHHQ